MKLATKIFAALSIGAASASVAHAGWEAIDETRSWNTERVQALGTSRTVFVRETKFGKSPKGKRYAWIVTAHTISCTSFSIRLKSIAYFDNKGTWVDGAEIPGYVQNEATIYPDTVGDQIAQAVCPRPDGNSTADAQRRSEIARLQALAVRGAPNRTAGTDSLGYSDRVRRKVAANLMLDTAIEGSPSAEVTMLLAQDGKLLLLRLTKSSGDAAWDSAVMRAIERSDPLPRGENGKAPEKLTMTFSPKD
ncbi:energy transducer TonB [Cupriavidus pauculus]|uniref:TonB C-terminal domain-containing protein n=1 Tax=Cupriavidus pauculus TaxID=82633 RepID=A0A2N5C487_9BURK|nr:energy transducer TonB [Cupriavidus pauculus]PLP96990.1 hypothetical protein CYJ10_29550 [Cupriavidus pauculus]